MLSRNSRGNASREGMMDMERYIGYQTAKTELVRRGERMGVVGVETMTNGDAVKDEQHEGIDNYARRMRGSVMKYIDELVEL